MKNIEYSEDGKTLIRARNVEGHFVVPDYVTEIGWGAFEGCTGLTSIEIPDSVTKIGHGAFGTCIGLTSIEIPNSVTEIGSWAFFNSSFAS